MSAQGLQRLLGIVILVLAVLSAGILAYVKLNEPDPVDVALKQLLNMALVDLQGEEARVNQWEGKILVINFWATWCPPCVKEMPTFSHLQTLMAEKNVQFVGITAEPAEKVQAFVNKTPVTYPILLDRNWAASKLSKELGNSAQILPYTLIVDPNGQIQAKKMGLFHKEELEQHLEKLLRSTDR